MLITELLGRNARFVEEGFTGFKPIEPTLRTLVVCCVDPRVDPSHVLGLRNGDAVVIRNVGGRVTPELLSTLIMLRLVVEADGTIPPGRGWNLVVLHHTDCGITRLLPHTDLLRSYLGTGEPETIPIVDPGSAVEHDVRALRSNPILPAEFELSGLVYDVRTGEVTVVVPPAPVRAPVGS